MAGQLSGGEGCAAACCMAKADLQKAVLSCCVHAGPAKDDRRRGDCCGSSCSCCCAHKARLTQGGLQIGLLLAFALSPGILG